MIILISRMKPSPSGFIWAAKSGQATPATTPRTRATMTWPKRDFMKCWHRFLVLPSGAGDAGTAVSAFLPAALAFRLCRLLHMLDESITPTRNLLKAPSRIFMKVTGEGEDAMNRHAARRDAHGRPGL